MYRGCCDSVWIILTWPVHVGQIGDYFSVQRSVEGPDENVGQQHEETWDEAAHDENIDDDKDEDEQPQWHV